MIVIFRENNLNNFFLHYDIYENFKRSSLEEAQIKAGFYLNLSKILGRFKERSIKLKPKKVLENHQTVDCPQKGIPGWGATDV